MNQAIGLVGGILGIVGVLSAALVVARGTIARGTIQLLEDNQAALKGRVETLDAENRLLRERVTALEHTKDELFQQVKSIPEFQAIAQSIVEVNRTMERLINEVRQGLTK